MTQPTATEKLDKAGFPKHIAVIMDGNGRWAQKKGMTRTFGHKNAVESVRSVIQTCGELQIPYLTLYAFSTENWKRPKIEINFLMTLLSSTIKSELKELHEKGVKLRYIGEISELPKDAYASLKEAEELTKNNTGLNLIIALNYGAKQEIIRAVKQIAEAVKKDEIDVTAISPELFEQNLYTNNIPNVDLLIRTSGEYRISNFLLWQIAYSELYFTDTLWPDFRKEDLIKAIAAYTSRERRYGKTGEQIKSK